METLNWMIHVPKFPDCSPQPPRSPPSPCSAPSFPATHTQAALVLWNSPSGFPHSCKCIRLLVSSSSPSQIHPLPWDSGSMPPPAGSLPGACGATQSPSSCRIHAGGGCFLCPAILQGRNRARSQPLCSVPRLDSCRKERIINESERVSQMGLET